MLWPWLDNTGFGFKIMGLEDMRDIDEEDENHEVRYW